MKKLVLNTMEKIGIAHLAKMELIKSLSAGGVSVIKYIGGEILAIKDGAIWADLMS